MTETETEGSLPISSVVERWDVHPGDVLLVRVPESASGPDCDRMRVFLKGQLPASIKVIVVTRNVEFSVIRSAEHESESTMTGLSDQELTEIEARHRRYDGTLPSCEMCCDDWPCDAVRLFAEVRQLREGIRQFLGSGTVTQVGRTDFDISTMHFRAKQVEQFDALQRLVEPATGRDPERQSG